MAALLIPENTLMIDPAKDDFVGLDQQLCFAIYSAGIAFTVLRRGKLAEGDAAGLRRQAASRTGRSLSVRRATIPSVEPWTTMVNSTTA